MEYTILESSSYITLIEGVNAAIENGYKPYGNLVVFNMTGDSYVAHYQAMIKETV